MLKYLRVVVYSNNCPIFVKQTKINIMELTEEQLEVVRNEGKMYKALDENCEYISKGLWNKFKIAVRVYYKNGEIDRVEEF